MRDVAEFDAAKAHIVNLELVDHTHKETPWEGEAKARRHIRDSLIHPFAHSFYRSFSHSIFSPVPTFRLAIPIIN